MTIDEAISHALEVAGEQQERADSAELIDILDGLDVEACKECAADHRQLAEWLTELKDLREENKVLISECDRLIKEKGELLKMVNQPCTLCGNNCQVSPVEQFNVRNELCKEREQMYRRAEKWLKSNRKSSSAGTMRTSSSSPCSVKHASSCSLPYTRTTSRRTQRASSARKLLRR